MISLQKLPQVEKVLTALFLLTIGSAFLIDKSDVFKSLSYAFIPASFYYAYKNNLWNEFKESITISLLIFSSFYIISSFWAVNLPAKEIFKNFTYFVAFCFSSLAIVIYGSSGLARKKYLMYSFQAIIVLACIINIAIFFHEGAKSRMSGIGVLNHPITGAIFLICFWPLSLISVDSKSKRDLCFTLITWLATIVYAYFTQSRGPLGIGLVAGLSIFILFKPFRWHLLFLSIFLLSLSLLLLWGRTFD